MTFRSKAAASITAAALLACSAPTEPSDSPDIVVSPTLVPVNAAAPALVSLGTPVTVTDVGWQRSFGGTVNIEADASVLYAVVFGGSGGSAPVTGVALGSVPLVRVHSATGSSNSAIDVYRLVSPATGAGQRINVTRSQAGYDPVRVTVFTARGASTANPNGPVSTTDLTPASGFAVKSLSVPSSDGALTLSLVAASPRYVDGTGVTPAATGQALVSTGEDTDGNFGVVASAPGEASTTHSWRLQADQGGRYVLAVSFSVNPGAAAPTPAPTPAPPPVQGAATFGTVATFSDVGWVASFGGPIQVESDATVMYAVVFNGTGGNAPITGVSLGGQAFTRVKAAERTKDASLDVFRLVGPAAGTGTVSVQRTRFGYDPVRVSVFTVRGANTTTPNEAITETDLTPGLATATRSVMVGSSSDGLTISAVAASGTYANGTGIRATPGFQAMRAGGEDVDGLWGVLGSAPGAASVTHSWDLTADQGGRSAYLVSFTVNGASGSPPPPAPPPPAPSLPVVTDGWTTAFDYDVSQAPAPYPNNFQGWVAHERPWEQMLMSNLSLVQDATQPGTGSPGAARMLFRPTLPGGYAPINLWWGGAWPANNGSVDLTFTIKLSANWDNNGREGVNGGTKIVFFSTQPQNNHFIGIGSRRYDGSEGGGTGSLGGAWVMVGLQNPTVSYLTNADLTRNVWHTVRVQVVANTPGVANGQLRIWVDGQPVLMNSGRNDAPSASVRTDVMFYSAGQTGRQDRVEFEPTYGWGYESPPYDQWMDIGHVTAAVR